eukprot:552195-Amorphochlora_amoeboformis.AAC.1
MVVDFWADILGHNLGWAVGLKASGGGWGVCFVEPVDQVLGVLLVTMFDILIVLRGVVLGFEELIVSLRVLLAFDVLIVLCGVLLAFDVGVDLSLGLGVILVFGLKFLRIGSLGLPSAGRPFPCSLYNQIAGRNSLVRLRNHGRVYGQGRYIRDCRHQPL